MPADNFARSVGGNRYASLRPVSIPATEILLIDEYTYHTRRMICSRQVGEDIILPAVQPCKTRLVPANSYQFPTFYNSISRSGIVTRRADNIRPYSGGVPYFGARERYRAESGVTNTATLRANLAAGPPRQTTICRDASLKQTGVFIVFMQSRCCPGAAIIRAKYTVSLPKQS